MIGRLFSFDECCVGRKGSGLDIGKECPFMKMKGHSLMISFGSMGCYLKVKYA